MLALRKHCRRCGSATQHTQLSRLVTFSCIGLSGFIIDATTLLALSSTGLDHRVARTVAFAAATTWTWALNRGFTFADRPATAPLAQWLRFSTASVLAGSVNIGTYIAMTSTIAWLDNHRLIALAIGVGMATGIKFGLAQGWVYPADPDKNTRRSTRTGPAKHSSTDEPKPHGTTA